MNYSGGTSQPTSYYDMTPEQQAQAGAAALMSFMQSCPGKSSIAGVTGFGLGGVFGLFMASVCTIYDIKKGINVNL
jgi:import inner membrane translocase subunit TIM22